MSGLGELYERNARFVDGFDKGDLPIKPNLSMIILCCVDARVSPEHVAGVELGDALILRTAGARVTDSAALEVRMLWTLMSMASGATPDMELVIMQHSQCGMERFALPEVAAKVTEIFGTPDVVDTYGIADNDASVAGDIERLRNDSSMPRELKVSGHVYDIATGQLREVVPTAALG
jgi:carbonic anhydrase